MQETSAPAAGVDIALNVPRGDGVFTYAWPTGVDVPSPAVGRRVVVPFGGRELSGFVVAVNSAPPPGIAAANLQEVVDVLDPEPLFGAADLDFYRRAAAYYQTPLGVALQQLLPGGLTVSSRRFYRLTGAAVPERGIAAAVAGVLAAVDGEVLPPVNIAAAVEVTAARLNPVLRRGVADGWLAAETRRSLPRAAARWDVVYRVADEAALRAAVTASHMAAARKMALAEFLRGAVSFRRRDFLDRFPGRGELLARWVGAGWLAAGHIPSLRQVIDPAAAAAAAAEPRPELVLSDAQRQALEAVCGALDGGGFAPFLLHGVTGSGKTEIYLRAMAAALECGFGVICLVPEIALTVQLLDQLLRPFGDRLAVLHSGLGAGERYDQWRRVAAGTATVVLGARSAVFAPVKNLGLIIVDEEHEPSYKQETAFPYHGRDMALLRGKLAGCPVVMGSATPAVTTYYRARRGHCRLLQLPERVGPARLPRIDIVDLQEHRRNLWRWNGLTPPLERAIAETLASGRQVMLFLNRRGFSHTLFCRACGHMPPCPHCSVRLTFYKGWNRLVCHYCGHAVRLPTACPACGAAEVEPIGVGVQQLEETVREHFPGVEPVRLDRDSTRRKGSLARLVTAFARGEHQLLIGTQMLAKGLHFPGVDLVGVICADMGLSIPEYIAAERTFQLLTQVAGRAGRGGDAGRVIIQTLLPQHYSIGHAVGHDYVGFAVRELKERRELGLPPWAYLVLCRAQGEDEEQVKAVLTELRGELRREAGDGGMVEIWGPVPHPVVRVRRRFRWNLLCKSVDRALLHDVVRRARAALTTPRAVQLTVDIDPLSLG
ncbi:MAG: primosomal protein N' [Deltaproteobacteria bacterium]|nr:primosomal protein N' [Candidatus Anaeroferrophillacea bacterium]